MAFDRLNIRIVTKELECQYCGLRPAIIEGDIAKIPLGKGAKDGYALVDVKFSFLDKYKWNLGTGGYAVTQISKGNKTYLHKIIMPSEKRKQTDHINRNKLDNRISNLRTASASQNRCNVGIKMNNKTGYKGVSYLKSRKQYIADIRLLGKITRIGYFQTGIEAAKAYDKMALKLHKGFAVVNNV